MLPRLTNFSRFLLYQRINVCKTLFSLTRHSSNYVTLEKKDNLAIIRINDKKSEDNLFSRSLFDELAANVEDAETDPNIDTVVYISGKPHSFLSGPDPKLFKEFKDAEDATKFSMRTRDLTTAIRLSPKFHLAAITGNCLGPGLELALACTYRIALDTPSTKFGFPEVKFGILPFCDGCYLLFQRCWNLKKILEMTTKGTIVSASEGHSLGLVDLLFPPLTSGVTKQDENLLQYLESLALDVTERRFSCISYYPHPLVSGLLRDIVDITVIHELVFYGIRKWAALSYNALHYPAVSKIVEGLKIMHSELIIERVMNKRGAFEAQAFGELLFSTQCRSLVNLSVAQSNCKKPPPALPKQPVRRLGVIGAGAMGSGITQLCLQHDIPTVMKDVSSPNLCKGESQIESVFSDLIKKKKLDKADAERKISILTTTVDPKRLKDVDMVIEAVFEDLELKQQVVKEVEPLLPAHAIFASNTWSFPICSIAQASKRPDKFIGMHYFSPIGQSKLLELVMTDKTSPDTLATAKELAVRQGKLSITVKDGPCFYTTRLMTIIFFEAIELMLESCRPIHIDGALTEAGWLTGPLRVIDRIGLDVACNAGEILAAAFPSRFNVKLLEPIKELIASGYSGGNSGYGLYDNVHTIKPAMFDRLENFKARSVFRQRAVKPREENTKELIQKRVFYRFLNEAVLCLQEGVLLNGPSDGDIGAVYGLGFPPFYGGPFCYVDLHGASKAVAEMQELEQTYGDRFKPCQLLLDHAQDESKRFHKY